MNITHIKNQISYYKNKYGFFATIKKCFVKIFKKIKIIFKYKHALKLDDYQKWIYYNEPTKKEIEKQKSKNWKYEPKISVIVPMYNTNVKYFEELVNNMIGQTYTNWELCLADGSKKENSKIIEICNKDERIKYKFLNENKGISQNTNEALKLATGDYIALLDHDDLLPIFALYEVVKTINENPDVKFIYSDEDKIMNNKRMDPHFKPDFAIDTLRSVNYICHFSIFKKELMEKLGGFRTEFDGAQDYDIILRMSELTNKIVHIPKVLYHWRIHSNSTAAATAGDAKPYAFEAGKKAIESHLERMKIKAKVEHGISLGIYRIIYELNENPKVSIIIPNMDHIDELKVCIDSILNKTTYKNYEIIVVENNSKENSTFKYYEELEKNEKIKVVYYKEKKFNYSKIINFGVKQASGDYIVQLNNDTELLSLNWLEELLGHLTQRKDIGAIGVKLYYPDNTIQHNGVIIGIGGVGGHILKNLPKDERGYFARDSFVQNLSAVTAACIISKKEIYEEVNYMDESFEVAFNDLDFCLKIREKGYLILIDPFVEFIHYESKSRGYEDTEEKIKRFQGEIERFQTKWKTILENGDPYFNPNFRIDIEDYKILADKSRK